MRCKWSDVDAERLATGLMEPRRGTEYQQHLVSCEECQAAAAQSRKLEGALREAFEPVTVPAGAVNRMLAALPPDRPALPFWRRHYRAVSALAIAAAVAVVVLAFNPAAVSAVATTVRQAISFIPGIGIRATDDAFVLAQPVTVSGNGVTLRVVSVFADRSATTVRIDVVTASGQPPVGHEPYLVDGHGRRYFAQYSTGVSANGSLLVFKPLAERPASVTLVADVVSARIPVPLVRATRAGLPSAQPGGADVTVQGITLHLDQVFRDPDGVTAHVSAYGSRAMHIAYLVVAGIDDPRRFAQPIYPASSPAQFDITLPAQSSVLRIERVVIDEDGTGTARIAIPSGTDSFALDQQVPIGRYTLVLDRAEVVRQGGDTSLRIFVHSGPGRDGARLLTWQPADFRSVRVRLASDGSFDWFEVPTGGASQLTIRFIHPTIAVDGPWVLPLGNVSSGS